MAGTYVGSYHPVSDALEAQELEELTCGVPKLVGILPDALHDYGDVHHNVALAGMVSDLTAALNRVNSQALVSRSQSRTSSWQPLKFHEGF